SNDPALGDAVRVVPERCSHVFISHNSLELGVLIEAAKSASHLARISVEQQILALKSGTCNHLHQCPHCSVPSGSWSPSHPLPSPVPPAHRTFGIVCVPFLLTPIMHAVYSMGKRQQCTRSWNNRRRNLH
ncbi:unnamed protein product, partial [Ectocarpus sp. 13 AM-2016]